MDTKNILAGMAVGATLATGGSLLAQQETVSIEENYEKAPEERVITVSETVEVTRTFSLSQIDADIAEIDAQSAVYEAEIARLAGVRNALVAERDRFAERLEGEPAQEVTP